MYSPTYTLGPVTKERAVYLLYWTLFALTVLLVASGFYLVFASRPTASAAYSDMERLRSEVTPSYVVRRSHVVGTWLWFVVAAAVAVAQSVQRSGRSMALAVAVCATAIAAFVTGRLLPWDQLALWSVTTGTNMLGVDPVFGDQVRFLVGGREVSIGTVQQLLTAHFLFGVVLAASSAIAALRQP